MASTSVDSHGGGPPRSADPSSLAPAFVPLEANPELLTTLLRKLGLSAALQMHDVLSLEVPELLAFVPRPALAVLLVFPVSAMYESHRLAEDASEQPYAGKGPDEPVVWFRQTIRNACGMMGLLHASLNGPARVFIEPGSTLDTLLKEAIPLAPAERSALVEKNPAVAEAHEAAASQGDTAAPSAQDDVDLHYVAFVRTESDGADGEGELWELDGRRKGPIRRGALGRGDDVLSKTALALGPLKFLEREGADLRFSCVALASSLD